MTGAVFENVVEGRSLPPHIVYKIRQNASFTATTKAVRDKYWHPGPGSSLDGYYQFGFVWLQVRRSILHLKFFVQLLLYFIIFSILHKDLCRYTPCRAPCWTYRKCVGRFGRRYFGLWVWSVLIYALLDFVKGQLFHAGVNYPPTLDKRPAGPEDVTSSQSEYTFRRQLKTWLFNKSFSRHHHLILTAY